MGRRTARLALSSPQYQVEGFEAIDYTNGAGAPTIYAYSVGGLNSNIIRWRPATQDWVSIAVVQPCFDPGVVRKMGQFVGQRGRALLVHRRPGSVD
jgi:hypothetical protein